MDRGEIIRQMVLEEIANDYENIDQMILPDVAKWCDEIGIAVERAEVVKALGELIEAGLAKGYILSKAAEPIEGMPSVDQPETDFTTYFYITKKGSVRLSDDAS